MEFQVRFFCCRHEGLACLFGAFTAVYGGAADAAGGDVLRAAAVGPEMGQAIERVERAVHFAHLILLEADFQGLVPDDLFHRVLLILANNGKARHTVPDARKAGMLIPPKTAYRRSLSENKKIEPGRCGVARQKKLNKSRTAGNFLPWVALMARWLVMPAEI